MNFKVKRKVCSANCHVKIMHDTHQIIAATLPSTLSSYLRNQAMYYGIVTATIY